MPSPVRCGQPILALCLLLIALAPRTANADPAFVYINANPDKSQNSVAGFLTATDGHSSPIAGAPFATGGTGLAPEPGAEFAHRIAVAHPRNLLFAANDGSGTISVFNIDALRGVLTGVPGSPFGLGAGTPFSGISLAASNDGRFLYASGSVVVSFFVDANGRLNEVGSEWAFSQRAAGIAVSGDNSHLFLSMPNGIAELHTGEGGLTAIPPQLLSIGSTATDLRVNDSGSQIWIGTDGGIQAYTLGPSGASPVPGMPFFAGTPNLGGLAMDDHALSLFAYSPVGPRLLGAHVSSNGSLTLGPGSPLSPAFAPTGGALSPEGAHLMLANGLGQFDLWATASDGSLAHVSGYPLLTGAVAGFPSVVTFPAPNPVPAVSLAPITWLAAVLLLIGMTRIRPRVAR